MTFIEFWAIIVFFTTFEQIWRGHFWILNFPFLWTFRFRAKFFLFCNLFVSDPFFDFFFIDIKNLFLQLRIKSCVQIPINLWQNFFDGYDTLRIKIQKNWVHLEYLTFGGNLASKIYSLEEIIAESINLLESCYFFCFTIP